MGIHGRERVPRLGLRIAGEWDKKYADKEVVLPTPNIRDFSQKIESKFEQRGRVFSTDGKSPTITAICGGNQEIKIANARGAAQRGRYNSDGKIEQVYELNGTGKANSITTVGKDSFVEIADTYRKLTPIEVERCFSLPDNYTAGVSDTARYHGLGNGWEAATIKEFFKHLAQQLTII